MTLITRSVSPVLRAVTGVLIALTVVSTALGGGGVTGTGGVAQGALTNFGSVFVNGIEYFTTGANVVIEGVPNRSESELRVGMQLRVFGVVNPDGRTGSASSVEYEADLRGSVDGPAVLNDHGGKFLVHGLAVRTDEFTVFESALGPAALAAGDLVEVSGMRDAGTGELLATFVSRQAPAPGVVVSGVISSVTARSFRVGALTVDYGAATLRDVPAGGLADGMSVRAKAFASPVEGQIQAADVRFVSGSLGVVAGTEGSALGVVSSRTASGFAMGGLVVRVDGKTKLRNGGAIDLVDGAVVEAEGTVQADESLLASRVTFRGPDTAAAQAVVISKDASGFWLVSPDGLRVSVTPSTRYRDRRSSGASGYDWARLKAGDVVAVSGLEVAEATILAESVSRVDSTNLVTLRAIAREVASPDAILVAMRAATSGITLFQDVDGSVISRSAFFAKAAGRRVKATGPVTAAETIGARTMEIEP